MLIFTVGFHSGTLTSINGKWVPLYIMIQSLMSQVRPSLRYPRHDCSTTSPLTCWACGMCSHCTPCRGYVRAPPPLSLRGGCGLSWETPGTAHPLPISRPPDTETWCTPPCRNTDAHHRSILCTVASTIQSSGWSQLLEMMYLYLCHRPVLQSDRRQFQI